MERASAIFFCKSACLRNPFVPVRREKNNVDEDSAAGREL
jgi:hypothetical protein